MTGIFSLLCLVFATRFAFPSRFRPITEQPPAGGIRNIAATAIGLFSGLAGVGGGIDDAREAVSQLLELQP
jgi:uncharacterized membrane protein YfcA